MSRKSLALATSALAAVLAVSAARAQTEILITEDWEPSPGKVWANGFNAQNSPNDHFISFSNESGHSIVVPFVSGYDPNTSPVPTQQANTIVATNLNAASSATKANPDSWSFNYLMNVTLTGANGPTDTASLAFTGTATATAYNQTQNGKTFTFFNIQDTPTSPVTQSTTLDGNTVYVNLPALAPNTLGSTNNGAYSGYVWATPGQSDTGGGPTGGDGGGGPPQSSPEPSTWLLSFLGLSSGLGAASWRRWRGRAA
jgi:hypothetical protein